MAVYLLEAIFFWSIGILDFLQKVFKFLWNKIRENVLTY